MSDLPSFRQRVRALYRATPHPSLGRQLTEQDLADAIGLSASELSRRLSGKGKVAISPANVHAIVRQLAQWQALQSQAEVVELLRLMDCPSFNAGEWLHPPLSMLTPLPPSLAAAHALPAHNLPTPISSFIGRSGDKARLVLLLASTRLLTITGAGGTGKTRLALEVARLALASYPHGVWLVRLASLTNPDLIVSTMARTLGCREEAGRPFIETLTDYLRPRRLLLFLDTCEHLRVGVAEIVEILLSNCPQLTMLATSREALGIIGEVDWLLRPLSIPAPKAEPATELMKYEAVALFVNRASSASPSFSLSAKNALPVAEICHRLEGIPLALELAAALIKVMSLPKLASRLEEHLAWLASADVTAPSRHKSLEAAIQWSYKLLSVEAQLMLARLSVFAGGWSLEAAEVLCVDEHLPMEKVWAVHNELVRGSLVVRDELDDEERYHMLEVVREYAGEQLKSSGGEAEFRLRHTTMYLTLVEQATAQRHGPKRSDWMRRMEHEHTNLRAALTWVLGRDTELAARLAAAMLWLWVDAGYMSEGRKFLDMVLAKLGDNNPMRAKILAGAAVLAHYQGDYQVAEVFNREHLTIQQELSDLLGIANALSMLGNIAVSRQDYETAKGLFEESLAIYRKLGSPHDLAKALANLADVAYYRRDFAAAAQLYRDSLNISHEQESGGDSAYALYGLGDTAALQGDYMTAIQLIVESITKFYELGNKFPIAYALFTLARVVLQGSETEGVVQAVKLCSAGAALFSAMTIKPEPAEAAKHEHTIATSRQLLGETAFEAIWQEGSRLTIAEIVEYVSQLEAHQTSPVQD